MIVGHRDSADLDLWTKPRDGGENRGALRAIGHSVGGILNIATGEYFAIGQKHSRPDPKLRIGSVRVLHNFFRRSQQL